MERQQLVGCSGGLEGALSAIAVSSASNVYVARFLTVPNEGSRTEVVHWNGTNWTVIAAGFGYPGNYGYVRSMALIRNDLFVAGKFTSFSQLTANNIARWDGTNWLALGSGLVGSEEWQPNSMTLTYVSTLAVHGNELFVGGSFTNAGGVPASNVAKWDGLKWSALGNGISGIGNVFTLGCSYFPVSSLAVSDAAVYVGGQFTDASGVTANRIAKWDGSTWSALRGGVAGLISQVWQYALPAVARCELPDVLALAFANNSLFVGGNFTSAGGKPSFGFGIWHESIVPKLHIVLAGSTVRIHWPSSATNFFLQSAHSLAPTNWTDVEQMPQIQEDQIQIAITPDTASQFFRLRPR